MLGGCGIDLITKWGIVGGDWRLWNFEVGDRGWWESSDASSSSTSCSRTTSLTQTSPTSCTCSPPVQALPQPQQAPLRPPSRSSMESGVSCSSPAPARGFERGGGPIHRAAVFHSCWPAALFASAAPDNRCAVTLAVLSCFTVLSATRSELMQPTDPCLAND